MKSLKRDTRLKHANNPTGWLVDMAIRKIQYCKIKQNRKRL